jgi:5'-nucleotidase/UDP-sugar diphosphatase
MKLSGLWRKPRSWSAAVALPLAALGALGASTTMGGCEEEKPPTQLEGQVHLTLLHTSDMHSRLFPYNLQIGQVDAGLGPEARVTSIANVGGIARISHIIGRERARASRVLHMDGGDCFQGAPIFNYYAGEAEIRSLCRDGRRRDARSRTTSSTRGALNLGTQLQKWATFPALAANYQLEDPSFPGASPLGALFEPYAVFDARGLKVAVIGMANLSSITSIFEAPNRLGITPLSRPPRSRSSYVDLLRPSVDRHRLRSRTSASRTTSEMIETTRASTSCSAATTTSCSSRRSACATAPRNFDEERGMNYIELMSGEEANPGDPFKKVRRYCKPRDVVLAHSGAFAKYVGRLDLVMSNEEDLPDFPEGDYRSENGFETLTNEFKLFPVTENEPSDPVILQTLEPYAQGLDSLANLELLVGYALDGSRRFSTTGGDSALGNMIATAMWLRLGVQTDFSLTNTTGIRADLVPGPVTVEQMFNIFPFDNSISKMQLSGVEVQDLFDFASAPLLGPRVRVPDPDRRRPRRHGLQPDRTDQADLENPRPGKATHIYIGVSEKTRCTSDADCGGALRPMRRRGQRPLLGGDRPHRHVRARDEQLPRGQGGSGFRVLQRNTTQFDTQIQQRDALIDYIRAGPPCGAGRRRRAEGLQGRRGLRRPRHRHGGLRLRVHGVEHRLRPRAGGLQVVRRGERARRRLQERPQVELQRRLLRPREVPRRRRRLPARDLRGRDDGSP